MDSTATNTPGGGGSAVYFAAAADKEWVRAGPKTAMTSPVSYSVDGEGIGWILFDDPAGPANIFNRATQAALQAALAALALEPALKALVILSAKEHIFIAGADLKKLGALSDAATAEEYSRAGQKLFQQVAESRVPVIAAIHGMCAGTGYELALACHGRIASDSPATQIGLPEVGIGTIPGWGGCVRLPRLLGARAALDHILRAQLLPAAGALEMHLVDALTSAAGLKEAAHAAALRLIEHGVPARPMPPASEAAVFAGLRAATLAKTGGHQPAPIKAIEVVAQSAGLPLADALALEAAAFGEVTAGGVCKNLVRVFLIKDAFKKTTVDAWFPPATAATAPAPIRRVGVVGAGMMGAGIAQWLAAHGHGVVLRDTQPEFVARGMAVIRGLFDEAVQRRKLSPADAQHGLGAIRAVTDWSGFEACDLVLEAIVENVAAKQALFAELEQVARPDALLASNTSALPIEEIGARLVHPERALGIHFFNPVSRMPLVELVLGPATARATAARALAFVRALGKQPVFCRSAPGFLVTRVLFSYLNEAVLLWEQGVPTVTLDAALRNFGWPMGPLRLIDEIGVDVTDSIFGEMAHYFPDRFQGATACRRMNAAGWKGRKRGAGHGFYTYGGGREAVNPEVECFAHPDVMAANMGTGAVCDHLMGVMIGEAQRCLAEGVVRTPDDVDFAMLTGTGFPAWRGGLMCYAQTLGAS